MSIHIERFAPGWTAYKSTSRLKDWWFSLTSIFSIGAEIGLDGIKANAGLLSANAELNIGFPFLAVPLPRWLHHALGWLVYCNIGKYKGFEFQTWAEPQLTIGFRLTQTMHQDHWGLFLTLHLFLVTIDTHIYDGRHWDDENNCPMYGFKMTKEEAE